MVPRCRSVRPTDLPRSHSHLWPGAAATWSRSAVSLTAMLIDFYEIAERNRKNRVLGGGEGIDAERILKPRHENSKAERVQAAIRQHEIFLQRRQNLAVLAGHLLHLLHYG